MLLLYCMIYVFSIYHWKCLVLWNSPSFWTNFMFSSINIHFTFENFAAARAIVGEYILKVSIYDTLINFGSALKYFISFCVYWLWISSRVLDLVAFTLRRNWNWIVLSMNCAYSVLKIVTKLTASCTNVLN